MSMFLINILFVTRHSEPRHMLLTELIQCVLAVILHKTVVFDRKNNSSLLCWGQWQPGIKVVVVVVIRLV